MRVTDIREGVKDMEITINRPRRSPVDESMLPITLPISGSHHLGWQASDHACMDLAGKTQGGQAAHFGAYDVTDRKFSTRVGRPPCRPPA